MGNSWCYQVLLRLWEFGLNLRVLEADSSLKMLTVLGFLFSEKTNFCSEGSGWTPQTLLRAIFRGSLMTMWVGSTDLKAEQV